MKGVEAVVAIVLMLLITISLVGLAYAFFQDTFRDIIQSGSSQINKTTGQIGADLRVEAAKYTSASTITLSIRNTGTQDIDKSVISVKIGELTATVSPALSGSLKPTNTLDFTVNNVSGMGDICGDPVRVTVGQGAERTRTISCS